MFPSIGKTAAATNKSQPRQKKNVTLQVTVSPEIANLLSLIALEATRKSPSDTPTGSGVGLAIEALVLTQLGSLLGDNGNQFLDQYQKDQIRLRNLPAAMVVFMNNAEFGNSWKTFNGEVRKDNGRRGVNKKSLRRLLNNQVVSYFFFLTNTSFLLSL